MVPTSCTISLETFYLNIFPLNLNAIALKIADECRLISLQANSTDFCCFTAHVAFSALASAFALPCTLPASGPPRALFFMVKKGIRFVLNPSSLLWAKQNSDTWRKELGNGC